MDKYLIDTNVFIRFLTGDDENKGAKCLSLFESIEKGNISAITTILNISEVCYVLSSSKIGYGFPHNIISQQLQKILSYKSLYINEKDLCLNALRLFGNYENLDFEDAFMIALMKQNKTKIIYSYDKDFDKFNEIERREP